MAPLRIPFVLSCVSYFTHGIVWLAQEAEGANRAGKKRGNPMRDTTIGFDRTDQILTYEVSDEALEIAAGTGHEKVGRYTLFFCTALDMCPGP
jgi:hypothetical protein